MAFEASATGVMLDSMLSTGGSNTKTSGVYALVFHLIKYD